MSALKDQKTTSIYLENPGWHKESLLGGLVVLHTIKCEKASTQIANKLHQNDFVLKDLKKKRQLFLENKNTLTTTELHEVHIDNLKVTEGSIVRVVKPDGRNKVIEINENEPTDIGSNFPTNLSQTEFQAIERERLVFKQEVARDKNSYFFKAKNGEALYVLGDNFYKDFKGGYKHFSFANIGASEAQKKSIVGIASFMYYFENLKILIITSSMEKSFYGSMKDSESRITTAISTYPEFEYQLYRHEGLYYLEADEILNKSMKHKMKGIEYLVKKIVEDYDIVLYDLPTVETTKNQYNIYFPILQMVENVTFTVNVNSNTYSQIEDLKKFFLNYKISLKGLVVDNSHEEAKCQ